MAKQNKGGVDWVAYFWANRYQPKHGSVRADIRHAEELAEKKKAARLAPRGR